MEDLSYYLRYIPNERLYKCAQECWEQANDCFQQAYHLYNDAGLSNEFSAIQEAGDKTSDILTFWSYELEKARERFVRSRVVEPDIGKIRAIIIKNIKKPPTKN